MERTAGRASWLALAGLAGAAALQPLACRPDGQAGGGPLAQAQADLLAQVGPGVVEPALARF